MHGHKGGKDSHLLKLSPPKYFFESLFLLRDCSKKKKKKEEERDLKKHAICG